MSKKYKAKAKTKSGHQVDIVEVKANDEEEARRIVRALLTVKRYFGMLKFWSDAGEVVEEVK